MVNPNTTSAEISSAIIDFVKQKPVRPRDVITKFAYNDKYGNLRESDIRDLICDLIMRDDIYFDKHYNLTAA